MRRWFLRFWIFIFILFGFKSGLELMNRADTLLFLSGLFILSLCILILIGFIRHIYYTEYLKLKGKINNA